MPISIGNFKTDYVTVQKVTYVKDDSGGAKQTYTNVNAVPIFCNIQPAGGSTKRFFGQRQTTNSHFIYFDENPGVERGYRLQDQHGVYYMVENFEDIAGRGELYEVAVSQQNTMP